MWAKQKGFTIVELLVVIVVIAILAAITLVVFNGTQSRARDSRRMSDLELLAKSTGLYAADNGDYVSVNCGSSGNGWLATDYDGAGPGISINDCLINGGYIQRAIKDPSGLSSCAGLTCYAYMKGDCGLGTFYYAHLETLPQNSTDLDSTCNTTYDTSYGMNYVVKVR